MKTTALDRFAVRGKVPHGAAPILDLADEFRAAYCEHQQHKHEAFIDLRNDLFPKLLPALERFERAKARIVRLERDIKQHHSEQRDRNAVTVQQHADLKAARVERKESQAVVKTERQPWYDLEKEFREWWKGVADWKNIKTLAKRRELYDAARGELNRDEKSTSLQAYANLWMDADVAERELFVEFQNRGLHSAIRAEIIDASKPKKSRTSPGMRYQYGRSPEPRPWEKLSIQFAGGLTLEEAIEGTRGFLIEREDRPDMIRVHQQIGTKDHPCMVSYRVRVHRPIPDDAIFQRWTLQVTKERQVHHMKDSSVRQAERIRGFALPIAKTDERDKPQGNGVLHYDLSWSVCDGGVNVCRFWSDHVNEFLVVPTWLVAARMSVPPTQAECDEQANALLGRRGIRYEKLQGVSAIEHYSERTPEDTGAANLLDECRLRMWRANRRAKRAERRIEHLYKNVVRRVCRMHDAVAHDKLDLSWAARYATRDLLRIDEIPRESRAIRQAIAPGKIRLAIQQYGLGASDEVREVPPNNARGTDVFTSYVASWRPAKRRRLSRNGDLSQNGVGGVAAY